MHRHANSYPSVTYETQCMEMVLKKLLEQKEKLGTENGHSEKN